MTPTHAASFRAAVKTLAGETGDTTPAEKPQPVTVEIVTTSEPATPVPVRQLSAAKPQPVEAAETPEPDFAAHAVNLYECDDVALAEEVKRFWTETGALPESKEILDTWAEANPPAVLA